MNENQLSQKIAKLLSYLMTFLVMLVVILSGLFFAYICTVIVLGTLNAMATMFY